MHLHKIKNINNPSNLPPILGGIKGGKGERIKGRKSGFTLVELIVTITIIAILGAIAFTAFNGFQSSARDSSRASDLANLSQALDTSYIKTGSYPNPDNSFTVTYSGGSLWYQGTVGDTLINILSSNGSKLSKKPTDPLTPTKEYTYSKSAYGNTYELSSNWEGDRIAYAHPAFQAPLKRGILSLSSPLEGLGVDIAYAASGNPTITYIKGNYNGMVAKTVTGSTVYVIATPSLTTSTGTAGSSIDVTTLSGKLLYHGQTNSGGIAFTPTLIYSSGSLPINDTTGQITTFTNNLQTAYSGSVISSNSNIQNVLTTTGATNITSLGASIITNYLGGSASAPPPPPATSYSLSNSLMFDSASAQYLSRTPSVAGNQKKWTWSGWVKRGLLGGSVVRLFNSNDAGAPYFQTSLRFDLDQLRFFSDSGISADIKTKQIFRDPSAWYHIILSVDTTRDISSDRIKIYINGDLVTDLATAVYPDINTEGKINSTQSQQIGSSVTSTQFFDGYLADVNFVDSGALDPTSFGYTDPTTNQWLPKAYTGTYGTNGFHLDFSSGASLGKDANGTNDWTVNGGMTATNNQVIDTPLNNFATLNPISELSSGTTLSMANLQVATRTTVSYHQSIPSTIGVKGIGKWYAEYQIIGGSAAYGVVGIIPENFSVGLQPGSSIDSYGYRAADGNKRNNFVNSVYGATYTTNDIIGLAYDAVGGTIEFFKNGVSQGTAFNSIDTTKTYFLACGDSGDVATVTWSVNFGQHPFAYTPPTGFKALSTANLPDPTIKNPKQYFDVLTYAGSSSVQTIMGLGFQPDFVWIKSRNLVNGLARDHDLTDSVRGVGKSLFSDLTDIEDSAGRITAFTSTGFSLGGGYANTNYLGGNYVAWNWKKGSALTGPGFDIVSYTGNGGLNTIAHNLGKKPDFIVIKNRDNGTLNWGVYHSALGATKYMRLNTPDPFSTDLITTWNNTEPTSTGFTVNTWTAINESTKKHIAYLWSEVPGFSKFGSYTGNGSSDGPFVYTGFRPRYVMIKRTDAAYGWMIIDTERDKFNLSGLSLYPHSSGIEGDNRPGGDWDILSNGFKIRLGPNNSYNISGGTYIYAAFAEAPFKYANAR